MRNRIVAVIDDNKKYLNRLEKILLLGGYDPVLVMDPVLAVDTVVKNRPDIVLMELRLPRKNGFEIAEAINRSFAEKQLPIIAMSELFKRELSFFWDLCGITRRIIKPFQPLDVIWAIENEMGGERNVRQAFNRFNSFDAA
ncbi:MAG: response regulator [Candidatus Omnitrophica bacterium]|nr:response regulator [Candidatus Omnitrophota bacterium]